MPAADAMLDDKMLARILVYGAPKTKKTWWALRAAEAGFNVLLLDSDDGFHIVKQIPAEARKRIYIMDVCDTPKMNVASVFMALACKQAPLYWLETEKKQAQMAVDKARATFIDFTKLDRNTVVVVDSWSAVVNSLVFQFARENSIDLSDATKQEWEGYRWCGSLASWMLAQLKTFQCHIIVIAHQSMYEKRNQKTQAVEWTRTQIKSTSGAHAMSVAQYFSDIFWFTSINDKNFRINTAIDKDRDGGSRMIPPGQYNWDEFSFAQYCKLSGIPLPPADLPLLDFKSNVTETTAPQPKGNAPLQQKPAVVPAGANQVASIVKPAVKIGLTGLKK